MRIQGIVFVLSFVLFSSLGQAFDRYGDEMPTFYESIEREEYFPMEGGPLYFNPDHAELVGVCLGESEGHRGNENHSDFDSCGAAGVGASENKLKDTRSQMMLVVLCRDRMQKRRGTGFKSPATLGNSPSERQSLASCEKAANEALLAWAEADEETKSQVCKKTHFYHRCYRCQADQQVWFRSKAEWVLELEEDQSRLTCSGPFWDSGRGGQWCETCRNRVPVRF